MTKPMKTADLESGQHAAQPKPAKEYKMHEPHSHGPKTKLTPEELAAGKTPNSGKLKKDGTPVPGQDAAHDAERAAERAAEAAAGEVETPDPTDPPVLP